MSTNLKKTSALLVIILLGLLILLSTNSNAQDCKNTSTKYKSAVNNYIKGLHSDNEGLRNSCIYFIGKYKAAKAFDDLVDQLQNEKNPETKALLSFALAEICSTDFSAMQENENPLKEKLTSVYEK